MKKKVYFAHPYAKMGSSGEKEIIQILESRNYEVINPFDGEEEFLEKHGKENGKYYADPDGWTAAKLWDIDLNDIRGSDILVAWIPQYSIGSPEEIVHGYYMDKEIIIISHMPHPSFAWHRFIEFNRKSEAIQYSSIENFKNNIPWNW